MHSALLILLFAPKIKTGSVVECPLCDREVAGSIPGQVIHHRNMTERLLKAKLSPNQTKKQTKPKIKMAH